MKKNKMRRLYVLLFSIALVIATGCEGPEGPAGQQGEAGLQGEAGPQGPQGPEGNANVTVFIFDGADFATDGFAFVCLGADISQQEMRESIFTVYLGDNFPPFGIIYYHVPGWGGFGNTEYDALTVYDSVGAGCAPAQPLVL